MAQVRWRVALMAVPAVLALGLGTVPAFGQGSQWTVIPSPNQGTMSNELLGVAAVSTNDIWSVGDFVAGPYVNTLRTLAEQWNGTAWTVVPTPNPGTSPRDYDSLQEVSATSTSDVWAVGYSGNIDRYADRSLIAHFDGTSWSLARSPNHHTTQRLSGVAALSSTDAWAVGQYFDYSPYGYGALIEHWNGRTWKEVPNPATRPLYAVAALGRSNVWAVGGAQILHWDGTSWQIAPSPQPLSGADYESRAVAAVSAGNIWAVGYALIPSGEGYMYQTMIEHWDGSSWQVVGGAEPNLGTDLLFGVTALSPTGVWAVGTSGGSSFVERWDGSAWAQVSSPDVGTSNNTLQSVAGITSTGDLWAVGEYYQDASPYQARTLVEACGACAP
jgi:hypothetical protein